MKTLLQIEMYYERESTVRVYSPLRNHCQILFWLSSEIFKTIIIYKAILNNSNILMFKKKKERQRKKMDISSYLYITSMTGPYYSCNYFQDNMTIWQSWVIFLIDVFFISNICWHIYYGTNERRSVCHALKEKFPHTGHQLVRKYFIVTSYSDTDRRGTEQ